MSARIFGRLDGVDIHEVTLAGHAIEARILTWGGVLRDLVVAAPEGPRRVLLGLETIEDYVGHSPSFGAVIGRYANRIGDARFPLDGREVRLAANEGPNTLHGGPGNLGRRVWSLLDHDERRCTLAILSEDGDGGWPGRVVATATYEIRPPATLRFELQAITSAPTPLNLTMHGYYNLDGSDDVRDHLLQVDADFTLPTSARAIPTGEVAPLAGTPFDFRQARPIRTPDGPQDYDRNFVLRRSAVAADELARAATLASPALDLSMELWTTEPGLQVYDGYKLALRVDGLGGRRYGRNAGLALEPQRFPDAPNHAHFPSAIVRPGEVSRQISELRFER